MALTNGTAPAILTPAQVNDLVVQPVIDVSVASQVCTVVRTGSKDYRVPVVTADPTAAWVAEGAEITPSDPTIAEVLVTPAKVAGLTIISRELAEDSSPEATQIVGQGLARDIARKIDAAFFGNTTTNGPAGLGSLTTSTVVESGSAFTNLDKFAAALSAAENVGAKIGAFVTSPTEALTLAGLKQASGSNVPLLGADPTSPTQRTIFGVPLYVSAAVAAKTVWAVPADRTLMVIRQDATLDVDKSAFFTSDRVAVRATMRVGFAYAHQAALVKITHA